MIERAKVGLMSIGLRAYWPQFAGMKEKLEGFHGEIRTVLSRHAEVVSAGMVDSKEASQEAGERFRREGIDVLFCHCATYSVSSNMIPAACAAGCPVVVLNLQPVPALEFDSVTEIGEWLGAMTCGCAPEMTAMLIRNHIPFDVVTGYLGDRQSEREMEQWCLAARAKATLRRACVGMAGQPYEGMMDLYLDRTNLKHRLGVETLTIEHTELADAVSGAAPEEIGRAKQEILSMFEHEGVQESGLTDAARVLAGMRKLTEQKGLAAISYHHAGRVQKEMEAIVGTSNLAFSVLTTEGVPCCVEGDVKSCIASLILKAVTGTSQLSELYALDFPKDVVVFGHSGSGDANLSAKKPVLKATEVFHGKTGKGYLTQFFVERGPVTVLALTQDGEGRFTLVSAEGECVDGPLLRLGDTNARVRFDCGMREFVDRWCAAGPTHHCVTALGHVGGVVQKVAALLSCRHVKIV